MEQANSIGDHAEASVIDDSPTKCKKSSNINGISVDELKGQLQRAFPIVTSTCDEVVFRPPYKELPAHDAYAEAIDLCFQYLHQKEFPLWFALAVSYDFVIDHSDANLIPKNIPFVSDVYQPIDGNSWCKAVIVAFTTYCNRIADGSLPVPTVPDGWHRLPYSLCAIRNGRRKMEDKYVVLPSMAIVDPSKVVLCLIASLSADALFAVFDGHGGAECANYAAAHLASVLINSDGYDTDPIAALRSTFAELDQRLISRCKHENIRSGATAVVTLVKNSKLYLAWCGDSSAAVLRANIIKTLTKNHSPDDPDEYARVEAAGGMIIHIQGELRVNGVLNVSRALGDIAGKPMISAVPDVSITELDAGEYLLILACDGVWDALDETEVYESIDNFVNNHPVSEYQLLAEHVVMKAKDTGATDNCTLIIVFLRPIIDLWQLMSPSSNN